MLKEKRTKSPEEVVRIKQVVNNIKIVIIKKIINKIKLSKSKEY
jgi:hypothetical protein